MRRRKRIGMLLGTLLLAWVAESSGQDRKANFIVLLGGPSHWSGLPRVGLDPAISAQYGEFGKWGYNLELGFYRRLLTFDERDFRIGLDFGLFGRRANETAEFPTSPAGDPLRVNLRARGMYLTTGVRHVFGNERRPRFFAGGGGGLYGVDIVELTEGSLPETFELTTYFEKYTAGGYLSGGLVVPLPWRLLTDVDMFVESKLHFVSFGASPFFSGGLTGPVYTLQVGFSP